MIFKIKGAIKGCSEAPIPTWAYLIITAHLSQKAKRIYFGELRQAIKFSIEINK